MSIENKYLADFLEIYGDDIFLDGTLKADGYDDCIVGIDSHQRVVYDQEKIIDKLEKDMTREEAIEFFYFNIEGAHVGDYTPLYMTIADKVLKSWKYAFGDLSVKHSTPQLLEQMKKAKRGNPNWYKGMRSANPYGRGGTPSLIKSIFNGFGNFLSSPFK